MQSSKLLDRLSKLTNEQRADLQRRCMRRKAYFSFWTYATTMASDFYTEDKAYLRDLCDQLQQFWSSDERVMVVNMPPRHGKSRTASLFVEWILGRDPSQKIITVSYNEELSTTFARTVRNAISEVSGDGSTVYSDIFPDTKIAPGEGSVKLWGTTEGGKYLASSPTGTVTGMGASLIVCDDMVKNSMEAYNERVLEQKWSYFTDTLLSRREPGQKIIFIMTRWATKDPCGRALEHFTSIGYPPRLILYKAKQDDGTMLCDSILTADDYDVILRTMSPGIVRANYQQEPVDIQNRLYTSFRTYSEVPKLLKVMAYCDTADEGKDYLCSIVFGVLAEAPEDIALLDVIYTQEPMETTVPMVGDQLRETYQMRVSSAHIESNNGGRMFALMVQQYIRQHGGSTVVGWFHQTQNKRARILTAAPWLMKHCLMPEHWADRWPEFWKSVVTFTADGEAEHDDAEDALTGVCEIMTAPKKTTLKVRTGSEPRHLSNLLKPQR